MWVVMDLWREDCGLWLGHQIGSLQQGVLHDSRDRDHPFLEEQAALEGGSLNRDPDYTQYPSTERPPDGLESGSTHD